MTDLTSKILDYNQKMMDKMFNLGAQLEAKREQDLSDNKDKAIKLAQIAKEHYNADND